MSLITRQGKGSKLTIEEMDNNFLYLEEKILTPIEYSYKITNSANIDWSEANFQEIELSGDTEFNFTGATAGQKLTLLLNTKKINNLTWPNLVKWSDNIKYNLRVNNLVNTFSLPSIFSIAIQADGKILVGGAFTEYNGVSSNRVIRLNSNGSIDTSFVIGTGFNTTVNTITIQSDGKILVGGSFTSYNGVSANRVIRLNSDGSRDTSFVIGTGFNGTVNTITIQSDGKILVGGQFTSYNGVLANRIIRLNSNGSVDESFVIGTGFNGTVNTITIQSDGKILVGGQFTSYNGVLANRIIRLNSNGSRDESFYSITNSFIVRDIKITNDFTFIGSGSELIIIESLLTYNKINFYYDGEFYIGGK